MKLKECLDRLAVGEVSNTSFADDLTGVITEGRKPVVVKFIQEGLDKLYARFYLRIEDVFLEIYEGRTNYAITSEHLMDKSLRVDTNKYLWKTDGDDVDDLIKIIEVASTSGRKLPINDRSNPISVFTPFYNVLQIPTLVTTSLDITYIAKHRQLSVDRLEQEIELPNNLFPALFYYVAYQIHNNINTQESVSNAQKYLAMYTSAINDVVETDLANPMYATESQKFYNNGWC